MLVSVVVVVAVKVWRGSWSGYHRVGIINYNDTIRTITLSSGLWQAFSVHHTGIDQTIAHTPSTELRTSKLMSTAWKLHNISLLVVCLSIYTATPGAHNKEEAIQLWKHNT